MDERDAHRAFLNRYYGAPAWLYDVTRRPFLLGRDRAVAELLDEPWERLVEVGPGTGSNLLALRRGRRGARLGGVEPCDAMLAHARRRCPFAALVHGFGEDGGYAELLGGPPDRVLFSYSLSIMQDPAAALRAAAASLAPGGRIVVVDFGGLGGAPAPVRRLAARALGLFHVRPLGPELFGARVTRLATGARGWWIVAHLERDAVDGSAIVSGG